MGSGDRVTEDDKHGVMVATVIALAVLAGWAVLLAVVLRSCAE